jgi:LysM repeat protein
MCPLQRQVSEEEPVPAQAAENGIQDTQSETQIEEEKPIQMLPAQRRMPGEKPEDEELAGYAQPQGRPDGECEIENTDMEGRLKAPGAGRPLPDSIRTEMESSLGSDFSGVRVHDAAKDHDAAKIVNAKAFTYRDNVWLGPGGSANDRKLMAHELTHVVQQRGHVPMAQGSRKKASTDMYQRTPQRISARVQRYSHTVASGENLTVIATRYGISVADLTRANPSISANRSIQAGQVINIPIREHTVASGDSLGRLARRYRVSEAAIQRANQLSTTTIRIGQVLAIPGLRVTPAGGGSTTSATRPSAPPTSAPASRSTSPATSNPAEILSAAQIRRFRLSQGLIRSLETWTSTTIRSYQRRLSGTGLAAELRSTLEARIRAIVEFRINLRNHLSANLRQGDDLLTLANIIYNEAGNFGATAHQAIAYAWLNRTGGTVSANRGAALSGYVRLSRRWAGFRTVAQKLTFITNFPRSMSAATTALNDSNRTRSDPTTGATHWVSPQALPVYNPRNANHVRERYSRTYGSHSNRGFPKWAVANNDTTRIARLRAAGQIFSNYREIVVTGIPGEQFLFYRGVRGR